MKELRSTYSFGNGMGCNKVASDGLQSSNVALYIAIINLKFYIVLIKCVINELAYIETMLNTNIITYIVSNTVV